MLPNKDLVNTRIRIVTQISIKQREWFFTQKSGQNTVRDCFYIQSNKYICLIYDIVFFKNRIILSILSGLN